MGVGAGMDFVGAIAGARSERRSLRSAARIADIGASMADEDARQALRIGTVLAGRRFEEGARVRGQQVAAMGANNLVIGEGSTARVLATTDYATQLDVDTIMANAYREAFGLQVEGMNLRGQAAAQRATASGISPFLAGATSALTSATKIAPDMYNLVNSTKPNPMAPKDASEAGSKKIKPFQRIKLFKKRG
jgi:hypothetical protein